MDNDDPISELAGEFSPEEARTLRQSLGPAERERVEGTVANLLDLLGRTHTMAILSAFAFADEPLRFSDLESDLDIPPNTLSTRLQELTASGLLDRTTYDEMPPRVEYEPTEKARALFPMFGLLHRWAMSYDV